MAKEREIERWITVKGVRVPIFAGESVADAVKSLKERIGRRNSNQPMTQKGKERTKKEYTNARNAAHNAKPDKQEKANARFEQAKQKYSESKQKQGIKSATFTAPSDRDPANKTDDEFMRRENERYEREFGKGTYQKEEAQKQQRIEQSQEQKNIAKNEDEKEKQIARNEAERRALTKHEKLVAQMRDDRRRREQGIETKYGAQDHTKLDQHPDIKKMAEDFNKDVWTREGGVRNGELYDKARAWAKEHNYNEEKAVKAAIKARDDTYVKIHQRINEMANKKYGKNYSDLEDSQRKEIAKSAFEKQATEKKDDDEDFVVKGDLQDYLNKKEASRQKNHEKYVARRQKVQEVAKKAFEAGENTPKTKEEAKELYDKYKQTETQKQLAKDQDEKEKQIARSQAEADERNGKNEHYDTVLNDIRGKLDKGELTPEQARNKAFEYEKSQRGNKQWTDVDKNKMQSKVRDIFDSANKREQEDKQLSNQKKAVLAVQKTQQYIDEETKRGNMTREKYDEAWKQTKIVTDNLLSKSSNTGNKTSSGKRTIEQMSSAQADGMRKLKEISSSKRFNEISFERPTTGDKLRVSVEKVKTRDYWGKATGEETYTLNIWNNSKTNEYGNHEREYYNYGIKDMKEVKSIIKRYMSM